MPGPAPTAAGFLVTIDGSPLDEQAKALMLSAYVDDSARLPDLFSLRFRDPERSVVASSKVKIGSLVSIAVASDGAVSPEKLLEGEVTALEADFDSTGTFTVIRGYDKAHRLFRGRRTQSFTQATASDVATQIAQRAGLPLGKVDSTSTVFDHLSQGGVSDWEFLDTLASRSGHEVTVRDGKLCFTRPPAAGAAPSGGPAGDGDPLVLRLGTDLLRFRSIVTAAGQVDQVEARGWDVAQKKAFVATAPASTTSADLPTVKPADLAAAFGKPVYVATDHAYRTQAETETAAKAIARQIAGSFAEFEGVARGNPKLRAGAAVSIANVGAPFDGKYVVTTSRHRYDTATGYTTTFAVSGTQERSLLGLTGAGGGRPSFGPVVAVVTDINDPEKQARVKLEYPWLSADYVSDWARTVQPGAGKNRGAMVLPEVGDEVLVVFEQGDLHRPYVLGGLYNGVDTPPTVSKNDAVDGGSGAVNRRTIVSRLGHRIDLLDEQGSNDGVTVATAGDKLSVVLDASGTKITVHSDGSVLIEGKNGVVIDGGTGKVEIKGQDIALSAKTGVTVDGGSSVKVSAGSELGLKGAMTSLEGSGKTDVKSSGILTVQGSLVKIN